MQLSELYLDRYLYKDSEQDSSTKDSVFQSANSNPEEPVPIPSGGAAQDLNTSNVFINGGNIEPGTIPDLLLDVANWGWGQTCAFASDDLNTVSWGAGTFTSAGGVAYSIDAGDTGNMAAKTYIFLDLNVSETVYQTTTTSADSVGTGRVLVAVAENDTAAATYNTTEANQVVADNILANTIDATKMNVGQLSAITADIGTITSGTIIGTTIKTSSTGERIEMSSDAVRSYDSSDVLRMKLQGNSLSFLNASGDPTGSIIATGTSTILGSTATNGNVGLNADGTGSAYFAINGTLYLNASGALGYTVASKDIVPTTDSTYDLGSTSNRWDTIYVDNITGLATIDTTGDIEAGGDLIGDHLRLNSGGNIYYNGVIAFDFSTGSDEIIVGSAGLTDLIPYTSLGVNLGTSSDRWNDIHVAGGDFYGDLDMNGNDVQDAGEVYCDGLRLSTGSAHNPATEGEITFYDSGSIEYRGQIISTDYSFDLTAV